MFRFICFILFSFVFGYCFHFEGWDYINLHCRNNQNQPVDWWFIYKPPSDVVPGYYTGRNFSFISSDTDNKWQASHIHITANSMLRHTLSPLFRPTYTDYLAAAVYKEHPGDEHLPGSTTHGVLMADEVGGLLLMHTIPDFPNMSKDRLQFPEDQLEFGHLIVCISLELATLNEIAAYLRATLPNVTHFQLPTSLKSNLPDWENINQPVSTKISLSSEPLQPLKFLTKQKLLQVVMLARRPADVRCLYKRFAMLQNIVLDIYGHDKRIRPICGKAFGLRKIDSVSLKYHEQVHYINNTTDYANFAVSTAAHWQRRASTTPQYWTCTSTLESQDAIPKAGFIICFEDYRVWWSFDNLKVKEPVC